MNNKIVSRKVKILLIVLLLVISLLNVLKLTGAKYKTQSETVVSNARVSKWITGTNISLDLFKSSYISENPNLMGAESVKSNNGDKIIAPGTSGSYEFSPKIEGNPPEVAYRLNFNVQGSYIGDWTIDATPYTPVKFSLDKNTGETSENLVKDVSLEELIAALNKEGEANTFTANNLPDKLDYTIVWEWPYYTSDENDLKDTTLATRSSEGELSVNLSANMSVEQLD